MIITRIRIQNLYCFADSELDLTYSRKPVNSTLDGEYLERREKFYFKKVCILSGANATGKTSLARILCAVQNFLTDADASFNMISDAITYPDQPAILEIEYVTMGAKTSVAHFMDKPYLNQLTLTLSGKQKIQVDKVEYARAYIRKNDSAKQARKQLQAVIKDKNSKKHSSEYFQFYYRSTEKEDIIARSLFAEIQQKMPRSWNYAISHFDDHKQLQMSDPFMIKEVLKKILQTFDSSIADVQTVHLEDKPAAGFMILFTNGRQLYLDDDLSNKSLNRLSTGTIGAIEVTRFFVFLQFSAKYSDLGTYYLDEKMAYAHSELEQHMLNLIIAVLPRHGQLFYTTHNYDILEMNLPIHSYVFLKKEGNETEIINPLDYFKKNDRNLLNYVKNDVFGTLPNTEKLDDLLESLELENEQDSHIL